MADSKETVIDCDLKEIDISNHRRIDKQFDLVLGKIEKNMRKQISKDFECDEKNVDIFDISYENHKVYCGYRVKKDEYFTHGKVCATVVVNNMN